jgi:hypothetical protein
MSEQLTHEERIARDLRAEHAHELRRLLERRAERRLHECCDRGLVEPADAQDLRAGVEPQVGQQVRKRLTGIELGFAVDAEQERAQRAL